MNTASIETETDLRKLVDNWHPPVPGSTPEITFRGQRNASWKLESTLERAAREKLGESFRQYMAGFEAAIIDQFIERCVRFELGHIYYPDKKLPHVSDTYEWLSLLQHYGHPTRLMDFTDDLWIAFYFALAGSEPNIPFSIFSLQMTPGDRYNSNKLPKSASGKPYEILWKNKLEVNVSELLGLVINFSHFQSCCGTTKLAPEWTNPKQNYGWDKPAISNVRIERQSGRFLYQLWPDNRIDQISELTKYTIAAQLRPTAMKMLEAKGCKYAKDYLFPTFEQS